MTYREVNNQENTHWPANCGLCWTGRRLRSSAVVV